MYWVLGMLQNLETSNNKTRNANIYMKYIVFIRLNSFDLISNLLFIMQMLTTYCPHHWNWLSQSDGWVNRLNQTYWCSVYQFVTVFPPFVIFLQLSEQPSLEEAIRIASSIQQGESPGLDDWWSLDSNLWGKRHLKRTVNERGISSLPLCFCLKEL